MNNNIFSTQYPTHPLQGELGQIIVHFGASKIETATLNIAAAMVANATIYDGNLLPETIAETAYNIALSIFEKCDEEYKKAAAAQTGNGLIVTK